MSANSPILIGKTINNIINGAAPFVPEGFKNPLNQGFWIDEIRFTMTSGLVGAGTWYGDLPDALRFALRIGNTELTKGLVPAALTCRTRDWLAEAPSVLHNFIWRFPKPLYLPRNGNLSVQLQQREDFRSGVSLRLDVDVSVVGRPTLDVPKEVHVPYATYFQGSLVTTGTTTDQSTENDLRNPFRQMLHIVRFSATNWVTVDSTGAIGLFSPNPALGTVSQIPGWTFDAPGMCGANTLRLFDADGDFGVRDLTPGGNFVALSDRSWKVNAQLKPNSYFLAEMNTKLSTGYLSTRQAVGMVGYRTIPLDELGVER